MPCSSSEGMTSSSYHDSEIRDLKKIVDDQADSLCFLRELVLQLINKEYIKPELLDRLTKRTEAHREFDKKEGR